MDALPGDLAESLAAAYDARRDIHVDICTIYTEGPDFGCSCGIPRLFEDLAALLGVRGPAAARPA